MKVKVLRRPRFPERRFIQTLLVMKLTVVLLALSFSVLARGRAQEKITLSLKGASLESVLKEIQKQTGYQYFITDKWNQVAKKVDISVIDADLEAVLNICFKDQPFTYEIIKKIIVIKGKPTGQLEALNTGPPVGPTQVRGIVKTEGGSPLAGATVTIRGTKKGSITNTNGEFVLQGMSAGKYILNVSFVGYENYTADIRITETPLDIMAVMKQALNTLDETQVIAYGTTSQRLNTGDVSTVKAAEIEKQPVNNPLLALEGRVPGMEIAQSSGLPGAGVSVHIRGLNNIRGGNDPLFVIDGVPYSSENLFGLNNSGFLGYSNETPGSPFGYLNPADIESIDVLKDADATAIYGSRGANGVVLITTKKGKTGQTKADINMQNGWGRMIDKMKLLNTQQYLKMRHEAFKNDGAIPNPNTDFDLMLWDTTRNTNWQKELLGGTGQFQDVQATVSGGNINTQFLIGAGYNRQTTVFPGDFIDQKGSAHFNINNISPNHKFKVTLSGIYMNDNNALGSFDLTTQAIQLPPDAPLLHNPDGSLNWAPSTSGTSSWPGGANPAALLLSKYNIKTQNLVSNANLSYEVISGFEIKTSMGYTNTQMAIIQTLPLTERDPSTWATAQRSSLFANNNIQSWIIEPQASYVRSISKGVLTFFAGSTVQQNRNAGQSVSAYGFNSDLVMEDIKSATSFTVNSTINSIYKYNALYSRLNYNWQDKYLLNITARRDGSSRFGPANQFHNFGAVGAGWIFSKEAIFEKRMTILSYGKLRASYGTTGSDQVGDYSFMDLYNNLTGVGVPYQGTNGIAPATIYTPDLAWEETKKIEIGIEIGLLKERVIFKGSYYRNQSSNQLLDYTLPAIAGFTYVYKNLNALVQNSGAEYELKTVNIKSKEFRWTSSFNISMNRNKLVSGAKGLSDYYQQKIGHPIQSNFVYHSLGVDPITGLFQIADSHGKPITTPNPSTDATIVIDPTLKFYGGLQNTFSYKGAQLDFIFQFVKQPQAPLYKFNYIAGYFSNLTGSNQPISVLNRWQHPGDVNGNQRLSQNFSVLNSWENANLSDLMYGDASFIRLKNVSLSWQLPERWKEKMKLQNTRVYIQGQNLLTITNYQGLDPETLSSNHLPPLRVVTIGLQVIL